MGAYSTHHQEEECLATPHNEITDAQREINVGDPGHAAPTGGLPEKPQDWFSRASGP